VSPLLLALLAALLIPLFVATWRTSLLGLALQGLILAGIAYPRLQPLGSPHAWLTLIDLGLVRGAVVPLALYTVMRRPGAPARDDTIAPSLFSWTLALGMVLAAFNLAEVLVSEPGEAQTLVASATAALLLGFLVLASAVGPFGQMLGALRIENAAAMLELSGHREASFALDLAMLAVFVATVAFFRWYLVHLGASQREPTSATSERESAPDSLSL
jgi:hydrogenase-4 membrane subunit HyfE